MKISNFKFQISNLIAHPLFSGSAIMIVGSNSSNVINYVYHLVMGRLLGPSQYGELATLLSLIGLLGTIPGSISLVVIKYISAAKNKTDVIELSSFLKDKVFKTTLFFFILIVMVSPTIAKFLHINNLSYLILIAISFLFSLSSLLNRSILQGILKFKEMITSILVESSSKLLIGIILVFFGFSVGGAVLGFVIASFVGWYLTEIYLKKYRRGVGKMPSNIKLMAVYTIPVLIQQIALTSLNSSDLVLVKHFFSPYDAGIYASLSTLGKVIFFGASPIGAVMFPLISQRHSQGLKFKNIFLFSFILTTIFTFSILLIYWLFPTFAISLLYGSAYLSAKDLLVWFGIFITLYTLSALIINFSLSLGQTKVVIFPMIASLAQLIGIWFYHQTILVVVQISILVSALLLAVLLIYSSYGGRTQKRDKVIVSNSSGF